MSLYIQLLVPLPNIDCTSGRVIRLLVASCWLMKMTQICSTPVVLRFGRPTPPRLTPPPVCEDWRWVCTVHSSFSSCNRCVMSLLIGRHYAQVHCPAADHTHRRLHLITSNKLPPSNSTSTPRQIPPTELNSDHGLRDLAGRDSVRLHANWQKSSGVHFTVALRYDTI